MMFLKKQLSFTFIIIILFLSVSCQPGLTPTATPTEEVQTATRTIPPTKTATIKPTATRTPTPTPSPTPTRQVGSGMQTPLPTDLEKITAEKIDQIQHLATWGKGRPENIQISKDGQILAVGTPSGVYFYDSLGLYELAFRETAHSVITIAFSSDSTRIAVGQLGGGIDIYNRDNFTLITRIEISTPPLDDFYIFDCYFLQENEYLVSVRKTEEEIFVNQYDTTNWHLANDFSIDNGLTSFINPELDLIGVIFEDNLHLQSLRFPEEFNRVDLPTDLRETFWEQFAENQGDISPTADGKSLLINNGSSVSHWEILSDDLTYQLTDFPSTVVDPCQEVARTCLNNNGDVAWDCNESIKPIIETIASTPDNIMMLISRNDNLIEFRRIHDGFLAWSLEGQYTHIQFSPGSEFFFGLRPDGMIEKRNTEDGALMDFLDQHPGNLLDIAIAPDNSIIAASFDNGWIQIYSRTNGEMLGVLEGSAAALDFSSDGSLLGAGLLDGTVRLFELEQVTYFDLTGHMDSITDLRFSSDGEFLLTGSDDCTISLWDINYRYRTKWIIPEKETPFKIQRVEFSPVQKDQYLVGNFESLYLVTEDMKISLLPTILLRDMALSTGGQTLAATGEGTYMFRDIDENAFADPLKLSTQGQVLALNNDGTLLLIGTEDGLAFWSAKKAEILTTIPIKDPILLGNQPISLVVSPDNTLIALGYQNGLIDIFGIPGN
jgi:WD40 repeat protein